MTSLPYAPSRSPTSTASRRNILDPGSAVTAILVPKPSGKAVSDKGFGGGETLTAQPTKAVVLPAWAKAKLAAVTVPNSTLHPTDMQLPNGLRLIVQPETISDTVSVTGEIEHQDALQTPHGKDGEDAVLAGLFDYGTTSLDRLAFQKALDDIAAQESAGTSFSLHVLKANFDRGVQLLADDELHPALPPADFSIVRTQTEQSVAGRTAEPVVPRAACYRARSAARRGSRLTGGDAADRRVASRSTTSKRTMQRCTGRT